MRGNSCCQDQDDPIAPFLFPFLHNRFWIRAKPSKGLLLSNNLAKGTIPNEGESQSPAKRKLSKKAQAVSWEARSCFDISRMAGWQDGRTKDET